MICDFINKMIHLSATDKIAGVALLVNILIYWLLRGHLGAFKTQAETMTESLRMDIGDVEIDFLGAYIIQPVSLGNDKWKFVVDYSLVHTGKQIIRIISTKFLVAKKDFWMFLGRKWHEGKEMYGVSEDIRHRLLIEKVPIPMTCQSIMEFTTAEKDALMKAADPYSNINLAPVCFYGTVKFHNGAGETYIKPFVFRFQWNEHGVAVPLPWHKHCESQKVYPTKQTKRQEKREEFQYKHKWYRDWLYWKMRKKNYFTINIWEPIRDIYKRLCT